MAGSRGTTTGMSATGKPKVLTNSLRQSLLSPELLARASRSREPIAISLDSAWDDNGNVCDWQAEGPNEQLASELAITGAISSGQPLTRADCDQARLAWDDNGNVCDWQAEGPNEQLASDPTITGAIISGQPLTVAYCDQARLAWDDKGNVCDWQAEGPNEQLASDPHITGAIISGQPLTRADCDPSGQARLERQRECL